MTAYYAETRYGFDWGSASIMRGFSDDEKGWVTLLLATPKHVHNDGNSLQIYVTRTGKVRISGPDGEWTPPKRKGKK